MLLIFGIKLCMFRTVPLSIIRSFSLYTQQWYMSYRFANSLWAVSKHVWHIPYTACKLWAILYFWNKTLHVSDSSSVHHQQFFTVHTAVVYVIQVCQQFVSCQQTCMTYTIAVCTVKNCWWWTEELSETCRVYSKNKFEKVVHLVRFVIRINWRTKIKAGPSVILCTINTPCTAPWPVHIVYYHNGLYWVLAGRSTGFLLCCHVSGSSIHYPMVTLCFSWVKTMNKSRLGKAENWSQMTFHVWSPTTLRIEGQHQCLILMFQIKGRTHPNEAWLTIIQFPVVTWSKGTLTR